MSRAEIWLYRFSQPDKRRPVLVLSRQDALEVMETAIVSGITRTIRGLPTEFTLGPDHGLKELSVVNLDHIFTVRQADLRKYVGALTKDEMRAVCRALGIAAGCT